MSRGSDFFEFGAEWVGADFHLHTRADKKFEYAKGGNDFQSDYISALKNAGIDFGKYIIETECELSLDISGNFFELTDEFALLRE